jgi:FkbM family methyltransferase
VTLPPGHSLPFYQRRDPTYDRYAERLIARIARVVGPVHVIDLGANVGDTAVGLLAADENISVSCVEGDAEFVSYLKANTAAFNDRVEVIEGFVGPVANQRRYVRYGGTGGFQGGADKGDYEVTEWVDPVDLLRMAPPGTAVVWKSDIDGFDIHVLAQHWDVIHPMCPVLWFEYDPVSTLGDPADVDRLITLLSDSGRKVEVFDNLGRRLVSLEPGAPVRTGLQSLTTWLHEQRDGHVTVPYVDVWALDPDVDTALREVADS